MRRGTYIAAIASGGENPIRKTTLRFDLYCSEVVIFLFAAADADADILLVHDIIYCWCCWLRSISAPNSFNVLITCTATLRYYS